MGYLRITSVRVQKCEENVKRLKKRVIKFFTLQEANKYYEKRKENWAVILKCYVPNV